MPAPTLIWAHAAGTCAPSESQDELTSEAREQARGYRDTAQAMIAAHAQATTPQASSGNDRGPSVATLTPLAAGTGPHAEAASATTWLTLALHDRIGRAAQPTRPGLEAEAGA